MKTLFVITLFVALAFGLGFIFIPGFLLSTYGILDNPNANALIRNMGTALLGFAALLWFGIKVNTPAMSKAVLTSMSVYWLLSSITIAIWQLTVISSFMGWATVALHMGFLIVYGYYLVKE